MIANFVFIALCVLSACTTKSAEKYVDLDGDGFTTETDCDDTNPNVYPDAPEICDGADQDCDGEPDNDITRNFFVDFDVDGFGNPNQWIVACEPSQGFVDNSLDCDDTDGAIHPMASDICDDIDNNCNGIIDEEASITFYFDWDEDGYGGNEVELLACDPPEGFSENNLDCDDYDASSYPGAQEECNGIDNDCDGEFDNGLERTDFYIDLDGDGYGDENSGPVQACAEPMNQFGMNSCVCDLSLHHCFRPRENDSNPQGFSGHV